MCGALYKCIIIVYIIAVQALVAEFIIILRYLLGLYVLDCSTCRSGGKFISYVINLSYIISRHLLYIYLTYGRFGLSYCILRRLKRTLGSEEGQSAQGGTAAGIYFSDVFSKSIVMTSWSFFSGIMLVVPRISL